MAVIAAEWKLGLLETQLEPGIASEDEFVDSLSDFGSETHEVDEALRKFVVTAAEGNEGGQYFPKASHRLATYTRYTSRVVNSITTTLRPASLRSGCLSQALSRLTWRRCWWATASC
jgi:hypothetical protein